MEFEAVRKLAETLGPGAALHAVGGWVRDRLLGAAGGDLDLATALEPQQVLERATAAGYRAIPTGMAHGTVTVLVGGRPVEITSFRGDGAYRDGRRPDAVTFGVGLEADLARRDFTINAMALPVQVLGAPNWPSRIVDPFGGRADLALGLIRAVGDPLQRFAEDGLRPLRACRFASQLGFELEAATRAAIQLRLDVCAKVAVERVFTELTKLLCGKEPARGLRLLEATGLLDLWLPELRPMVGCQQNRHHRFDVWEHTLRGFEQEASGAAAVRWALLLHDAGKPAARTEDAAGEAHFLGHEALSEELADRILRRLRAPNRLRARALAFVRFHGRHPRPDGSDREYRRLLKELQVAGLGPEEWRNFQLADRWGKGWFETGHPDGRSGPRWWEDTRADWAAVEVRLRSVSAPALSARHLALDGGALMALAGRPPGPWLGRLQAWLLERVLDDPECNSPEGLAELAAGWIAEAEERQIT